MSRTNLKITVLYLLLSFICLAQQESIVQNSVKRGFLLEIEQNGSIVKPIGDSVLLAKHPFTIILTCQNINGVTINLSHSANLFNLTENDEVPDLKHLWMKINVEEPNNIDKTLEVNNGTGYHYIGFDETWKKCDSVIFSEGKNIIKNRVDSLYVFNGQTLPIKDCEKDLYLFAMDYSSEKQRNSGTLEDIDNKVFSRQRLKIVWKKEE